MEVPDYLQGIRHALTITVIGCGGTGSVLLQHLARINMALIALGKKGIILTCVDDDKVTAANCGRQLFAKEDIGKYKSVVMIERINRFYGTNWMAIPFKFGLDITSMNCFPGNILISCVDDVPTRKMIRNYIVNSGMNSYHEHIKNLFWIDTGNDKDYGQVIMSSEEPKLPNAFDMFPDLEKKKSKTNTPSCSLAEALSKQDLFINSSVALIAAELIWDLTQNETIDYRGAFINLKKNIPIRRIKA